MQSLATDVVGGFNAFVKEQTADGPDALITLVQFDSQEPHEVVLAAQPLPSAPSLTLETYRPRGGTPLYDAMAQLITDATIRAEEKGGREVIIFVTFTDGGENASEQYTKQQIFDLVRNRESRGWTFVYLGANQDSYASGRTMGYGADQVQDFEASSDGAALAFSSLSKGMIRERGKIRAKQQRDVSTFFEGDKEAEAALRAKP
jgi:hypothetical protein